MEKGKESLPGAETLGRTFFFFLIFQDRVSLCSFGACPGTCSVDQADLELTEINLSLSLGLKACTPPPPS